MVAGVLATAGYYMGGEPHRPRPSNPKGFFETSEINSLNEDLLASVAIPQRRRSSLPTTGAVSSPRLWLALVPPTSTLPTPSPELESRIAGHTARSPFCLKDPRFCYSLPAWRPHLRDAGLVCVFREPGRTANSIVEECRSSANYRDLDIDFDWALNVWMYMYAHVLDKHVQEGDWLFVHYDQVLDGSALGRLASFLGVSPDASFPDPSLKRSPDTTEASEEARSLYERLCDLARFRRRPQG